VFPLPNCLRSPVNIMLKPPYGLCLSKLSMLVNISCIDWFLLAPSILNIIFLNYQIKWHFNLTYLTSSIRISCSFSYLKFRSALFAAPCTMTPDLFLLIIGSADSIVFPLIRNKKIR
jgi:hypothetical protein